MMSMQIVHKIYLDTVDGKKKSAQGVLAITCDPGHLQVPGQVDMVPTSLPELPKPCRTPGKSQKPDLQNPKLQRKHQEKKLILLMFSFIWPCQGGFFTAYRMYHPCLVSPLYYSKDLRVLARWKARGRLQGFVSTSPAYLVFIVPSYDRKNVWS